MIEAGSGPRVVLLAYARLTGQNVKRAAAGAEGLVLDHYSAAATEAHLRAVGDPMLDAVPAELVGSVFCDSLEVYGADWTARLPDEFARRRGYDLLPLLHLLVVDEPDSTRIRADYHRTLAELYEENFIAVCRGWADRRGVPFRIQAYGTPPATVSSYRFADLFEGEGWGWRDIPPTRWASSAAHLYGRPVVSAEAWTWVHSPSFRATPLDLKGEAHEHFLNGVNQLVGHGWPYSPADAPGLGWFFYAAGALDDRNPWWPAMPELARYLSRLCWLLRQGEPVADVALYVPNEDLFATMGRAQAGSLDTWREARRRIPSWIPASDPDGGPGLRPGRRRRACGHGARTLPRRHRTGRDEQSRRRPRTGSTRVRESGGTVYRPTALADALAAAIESRRHDLAAGRRRSASCTVAAAISTLPGGQHGPDDLDVRAWSRGRTGRATSSGTPMTGRVLRAGATTDGIELTLQPYEATVVVLSDEPESSRFAADLRGERRVPLTGRWQVAYGDEPAQPVELPHIWEDQPGRRHYSGAATYTTTVDLGAVRRPGRRSTSATARSPRTARPSTAWSVPPTGWRLRGPVGEVARVRVNQIDCGLAWAPPYRVEITDALRSGAQSRSRSSSTTRRRTPWPRTSTCRGSRRRARPATDAGSGCRTWTRPWTRCGPVCCRCRLSFC